MDAGRIIRPLQAKLDEVKADGLDVMLCSTEIIEKVIALLKEQEPVKPVRDEHDDFCCGRCGKRIAWAIKIFDGYGFVTTHPDHLKPESKCNFCKYCGQAVKWE